MNAATTPAAEPVLLFNWGPPRPRRLAIAGFLAGSVMLHAISFYLFQIVYPPAVVLLPPPARVHLITADSEEGRALLRWVDAEDPALASATLRPPDARQRALPKLQHIPSYLTQEPNLKHAPPLVPNTQAPSTRPPGPVVFSKEQRVVPAPATPTRLLFSEELATLGVPQTPVAHFESSNNESPQAVRFRIGVNAIGQVWFCFPLNSSGDSALDEQARQQVVRSRFAAGPLNTPAPDGSLRWGMAMVEWGNDVARPATAASQAVTP
jgi:hypothetical protein